MHFPSWHFDAVPRNCADHSGRGSPFHSLGVSRKPHASAASSRSLSADRSLEEVLHWRAVAGPRPDVLQGTQALQGQRSSAEMAIWGEGSKQRLAETISCILARQLGWKSQVFIPQDSAAVAFHGPRFDFNDPESAFEEMLETLTRDFGLSVPPAFWLAHSD